MILNQTFTLSNGVQIPKLGLGTWLIPDNEAAAAVKASIDESLRKLGMDYADLIIIHCPQPWAEFRGAKRYGVTIPQLCIQYTLQLGTVSLPKSSNPDHIAENFDIFNFELSDEEMGRINALDRHERYENW